MRTNLILLLLSLGITIPVFSQIPQLNSRPLITSKVVYLDFDGQVVTGTSWNSGNTVNALPSTIGSANMILAWRRISEDFMPFDVNVTTDSVRFNAAPANQRIRVVITPTSAWYGSAGGVAYLNSFTWGGTPGTPCWVFENMLGYSAKNIAEAASHEVGHTLSLKHHSTYSTTPTCTKTAEYDPGQGTGVTSWAPIMGVGYSKNVTTWFTGPNSNGCNVIQYDHGGTLPGITSTGYLSFLTDDVGDTYISGKTISMNNTALVDSGLISTPADKDVYKFSICANRYVSIAVKPWALDTTNYNGANLDVAFELYNAANNLLIASDLNQTKLNTLVGLNLTAGSYYFTIDGGGSANYTDYGSLGRYYISIKSTNAPLFANTIVTNTVICQGQPTTLSYTSTGAPNTFQWLINGPSSSSSTAQYPSIAFNSPGTYTITLSAVNSLFTSCPVTSTILVNPLPALGVTPPVLICKGATATLTANGASNYTWMPGNLQGNSQSLSPQNSTNYLVTGNNGVCSNTVGTSITLSPDFTLQLIASSGVFCAGDSVLLNASGASSYTFSPGGFSGNQVWVSPAASTVFTLSAANGDNCIKQTSVSLVLEECEYTGLERHSQQNPVSIYPNPNNGHFVIEVTKDNFVLIIDQLGRLVFQQQLIQGKNNLNISDLPKGIYLLRFNAGTEKSGQRLIKE